MAYADWGVDFVGLGFIWILGGSGGRSGSPLMMFDQLLQFVQVMWSVADVARLPLFISAAPWFSSRSDTHAQQYGAQAR